MVRGKEILQGPGKVKEFYLEQTLGKIKII